MKIGNKAILLIFLVLYTSNVFAQKKGEEANSKLAASVLLFPEFYHSNTIMNRDTALKYECFDEHDRRIRMDTLHSTDIIEEIFYTENFFDKRYPGGKGISPPYITNKVITYTKVAPYTWAAINMANRNATELKGDINKIVQTDTLVTADAITGQRLLTIRKYYKVTEVPAGERHTVHHTH